MKSALFHFGTAPFCCLSFEFNQI